jgi:hemolysin activation/secretion protein
MIGIGMAASNQSRAQDRPPLPPALLPDIRLERLQPEPTPQPSPEVLVPPPAPAPPVVGGLRFVLEGVIIEGSTLYPEERLLAPFQPLIGKLVTISDVWRVAREIERLYREDGWFLTRAIVPAQTVRDGRIHLRIVEGFVEQVRIEGDVGDAAILIEETLRPVTEQQPLALATLERALLLVNDIPGVSASGLLRPAAQQVGAAELVVVAERKPFDASLVVDNFGDDFTGRRQLSLGVGSNAWTRFGERIGLIGFITDPGADRNQWVGQIATSWRFGGDGLALETVYSYGRNIPGGDVRQFDFDSNTTLIGVAFAYPFVRGRSFSLLGRLGIEAIDTDTDADQDFFPGGEFSRDKLRVLTVTSEVELRDPLNGANSIAAGLRQGLPILDATRRADENKSRADGTGQATVLRAGIARTQPLPLNFSFYTNFAGQYAFTQLLSNEEFTLGGTRFGRGYDFDELSGDNGIGGTAELRYSVPLNLPYLEAVQLFSFFEGGRIWNSGDGDDGSLASTGGGIRIFPIGKVLLELQAAQPLTRDSQRGDGSRDPQFLFRAVGRL